MRSIAGAEALGRSRRAPCVKRRVSGPGGRPGRRRRSTPLRGSRGLAAAVKLLAGEGEVARPIAGAECGVPRTHGELVCGGTRHCGYAELRVRPPHLCSPSRHSRPGTNSSKGCGGWALVEGASPPPRSPAPPAGAGMAGCVCVGVGGWRDVRAGWGAPRPPPPPSPSGLLRPSQLGGEECPPGAQGQEVPSYKEVRKALPRKFLGDPRKLLLSLPARWGAGWG